MLPTEGCREIHELRQHRDANARADWKWACVQIPLDDGVVELLHPRLAGGGETRDAREGLIDLRGVRSFGVAREHCFQRLVSCDALLLKLLGGMLARKDVLHCQNRNDGEGDGADEVEHLLDQRVGWRARLPQSYECAKD